MPINWSRMARRRLEAEIRRYGNPRWTDRQVRRKAEREMKRVRHLNRRLPRS